MPAKRSLGKKLLVAKMFDRLIWQLLLGTLETRSGEEVDEVAIGIAE